MGGGVSHLGPASPPLPLQVNRTFRELAVLGEAGGAWRELGPRIYTFLNSSLEMQVLRVRDPPQTPSSSGTGLRWDAGWGCVAGGSWWGAGWAASPPRYPGALQDLLAAPGTAQLLDGFLNGTSWKLPALAAFLGVPAAEPGLTWHQVYADADTVLSALAQFMEVRAAPGAWGGAGSPPPR